MVRCHVIEEMLNRVVPTTGLDKFCIVVQSIPSASVFCNDHGHFPVTKVSDGSLSTSHCNADAHDPQDITTPFARTFSPSTAGVNTTRPDCDEPAAM